jgi:hypothetical protein
MPPPWHFTTWFDWLDHWQTLAAGLLAMLAAIGTIWVTRSTASKQIAASREQADRMVAAASAQTEATFKQTEATVRLEDLRNASEDLRKASEALAFRAMLAAAMTRVVDEAAWARRTYPRAFTQTTDDVSVEAYAARQCITKGAFTELRTACVRQGGPLTGEFLDLEREIDSYASQVGTYAFLGAAAMPVQKGKHAGLDQQLASIERKATALREKAFERFDAAVIPTPGSFATAEAEALIGAPTPTEPKRRLWWRRTRPMD